MIDMVLMGLMAAATLGALGIFVYTEMIYKKPLPSEQKEKANLLKDSKKIIFSEAYKLDKMIINLHSRKSRLRFLDIQVYIVPFKPSSNELFEKNKALIHDAIIDVAGQLDPEELNSVAGKILFESRVKKRINDIVNNNLVKELYFSRFVVQ